MCSKLYQLKHNFQIWWKSVTCFHTTHTHTHTHTHTKTKVDVNYIEIRHRYNLSNQWWPWPFLPRLLLLLSTSTRGQAVNKKAKESPGCETLENQRRTRATQTFPFVHSSPVVLVGLAYLNEALISDRGTGSKSWVSHFRQSRTIECLLHALF